MNRYSCLFFLLFAATQVIGQTSPTVATVELLDRKAGGEAIAGLDDDTFFGKLYPREAATMTGVPRGSKSIEESRLFARQFFRDAVLEFTADEADAVRLVVSRLEDQFGETYPLLVRRPWKFIKTRKDLCGSFSFTRDDCIVINERRLQAFVQVDNNPKALQQAEQLFLHEQIHVLQREQPNLFADLYENICGFRQAKVRICSWIDQRQITNPDGVNDQWVFDLQATDGTTTPCWIGTILEADKALHRMGKDFATVVVPLQKEGVGYEMVVAESTEMPNYTSLTETLELTSQLPLPPGYDHVNEVGAYLFTSITHNNPPQPASLSQAAANVLEKSKIWFAKNLNPESEVD